MSIRYAKLKKHPRIFLRLFGLTPSEFEFILGKVSPLWEKRVIGPLLAKVMAIRKKRSLGQKVYYSGKKKCHTLKAEIHVSLCRFEEKEYNQALSRLRVKVEHVFAHCSSCQS